MDLKCVSSFTITRIGGEGQVFRQYQSSLQDSRDVSLMRMRKGKPAFIVSEKPALKTQTIPLGSGNKSYLEGLVIIVMEMA